MQTEVFVVGKPRSGTSVVRAALLASDEAVGSRRLLRYQPPSVWQSLVALLCRKPPSAPSSRERVDNRPSDAEQGQAPSAVLVADGKALPNVFYLPTLMKTQTDRKIIHVIRDVRGVLVSQRKKWSIKGNKKHGGWLRAWLHRRTLPNNVYTLITVLIVWLRVMQLDEHYRKALGDRYMPVRYEDFLSNPADTMRAICDFIGIAYSEKMLEVEFDNSSFSVATEPCTLAPRSGVDGVRADRWRASLSKVESSLVSLLAARQLRRLAYEPALRQ